MTQTIKLKRSASQGATPSTSDLALGEVAINTYDGKMYIKKNDGSDSIVEIGSGGGGGSGLTAWAVKTANHTAADGERLLVDTSSGAVTITLPASPSSGDAVNIIDAGATAAANNITVARNSEKIDGEASDLTVDVNGAAFGLVYYNTTRGWVFIEK